MLGNGGKDVSIVPFVYPRRMASVSSLGYFSFVGSSSKSSNPYLPVSVGALQILEYFKNKRGGGTKIH